MMNNSTVVISCNELWCLRVYTFHGELNTRRVVPRRSDCVTKRFGRYFSRRAVLPLPLHIVIRYYPMTPVKPINCITLLAGFKLYNNQVLELGVVKNNQNHV